MTELTNTNDYLLVIDDDVDLRYTVCEVLTDEGYRTVGMNNGREAMNYLRSRPAPRLIILDLMMPELDGWAFRAEQRADPVLSRIPVMIMSASRDLQDVAIAGTPILPKPVQLMALLRMVERLSKWKPN